jgi:hypothetical protein
MQKKYIRLKEGAGSNSEMHLALLVPNWVSFCFDPVFLFFLTTSTAVTYIFTAPTCTTTIITLEPWALNAEFQHFIPRFNKTSLLADLTQRGDRRWKDAQRQGVKTWWLLRKTLLWIRLDYVMMVKSLRESKLNICRGTRL